MRIEQQNNILEMLQQNMNVDAKGSNALFAEKATVAKSKYSDNQSIRIKDSTYLNPALEDRENLTDILEESTALDATDRKNQMAVLSHTTSEEDFAKMQEEGFSLNETTGNTIVTVTDKIKLQIAKGGGDISCFGDDLSKDQLEELTGSVTLAQHLEQKLKASDLPVTEENIAACEQAYKQAESVGALTDGSIKYLLDNQLTPTIENFYKASYVGGKYYTTSGNGMDMKSLQNQITGIIKSAGMEVNEQSISDSKWLIANDIALTADNLNYLSDLRKYNGALSEEEVTSAMMTALTEGKSPAEAFLLSGYDCLSRAKDAVSVIRNATDADIRFIIDCGLDLTVKNLKAAGGYRESQDANARQINAPITTDRELSLIAAHRQLEETRLAMTVEANYSLLKRGMAIETKPLVELVESLKKEENQYYASLLEAQGMEVTEEKITLFAETQEKLSAIKSVPAYVLGIPQADVGNIKGVYLNGMALKAAMEKANQSYETLMTAPRSDLGDSYSKAFGNIDDILSDLDLGLTEANRRAVRILAYNQLEITADAVVQMKAADEEVQRVFKNLTPSVVIEMLHKGENPLDMDFRTLNKMAESIKQELNSDDTERFSEFLWKMEQNKSITEDERSSFIGVYRLLHQIERSDGAAIGAVLNQGADLTLRNLLTAVRSANKQNEMDVTIDNSFGEKQKETGYTNSITDQIMAGYQHNCIKDAKEALTPGRLVALEEQGVDWMEMTPEQLAEVLQQVDAEDTGVSQEYAREQLDGFRHCANVSEEVYRMLEQYDIPNSVQNILAMETMMSDRNQLFQKILGQRNEQIRENFLAEEGISPKEEIENIKQQLIEDFGKAVTEPKEMAEAQEALGKLAENIMKTMIESDDVTCIDLKEAKLLRAQLSVQKKMSQKETYSVPVLVGDEVTNVTLKIVRGVEKRGFVDIILESQLSGKIAATFQAKEKGISGMIATDNQDTKEDMLKRLDQFVKAVQGEDIQSADIKVAYITDLDLNHFSNMVVSKDIADVADKKEASADTDAYRIQTTRLYRMAEAFIHTVKEIYK